MARVMEAGEPGEGPRGFEGMTIAGRLALAEELLLSIAREWLTQRERTQLLEKAERLMLSIVDQEPSSGVLFFVAILLLSTHRQLFLEVLGKMEREARA